MSVNSYKKNQIITISSMTTKKSKLVNDNNDNINEYDEYDDEEKYINISNFQSGEDPIIQQLPSELQKYVIRPEDQQGELVFVNRSPTSSFIHTTCSIICCCWSIGCCRTHLVKQGEIGLTQFGDEPQILGPGWHSLLSPANTWLGVRDFRTSTITHGPLHMFVCIYLFIYLYIYI